MRFAQDEKYPRCSAYLANYLSMLDLMDTMVYDAFLEVCEADDQARQALIFYMNPLVHIGGVPCGKNGVYKGRFGGPKHTVYINTQVAQKYEYEFDSTIWESTVLHEMVHWARYVGGQPALFEGQEAGKAFEVKAYGKDISCGCYKCEI